MDAINNTSSSNKSAKHCLFCESIFYTYLVNRAKFCSKSCAGKFRDKEPKHFSICAVCNVQFKAKRTSRLTCCSRECGFIYLKNQWRIKADIKLFERLSNQTNFYLKPYWLLSEKAALIRISKKAKENKRVGNISRRCCDKCKISFPFLVVKGMPPRYCRQCKADSKKEARRKQRSYRKHKGRATKFGAYYEPVDPIKVFNRDKWRCHLCGIKTPKSKRGSFFENAPELDHIVTMAEGGAHAYNNVACACRKCNQIKSSRSRGQLLIIG